MIFIVIYSWLPVSCNLYIFLHFIYDKLFYFLLSERFFIVHSIIELLCNSYTKNILFSLLSFFFSINH